MLKFIWNQDYIEFQRLLTDRWTLNIEIRISEAKVESVEMILWHTKDSVYKFECWSKSEKRSLWQTNFTLWKFKFQRKWSTVPFEPAADRRILGFQNSNFEGTVANWKHCSHLTEKLSSWKFVCHKIETLFKFQSSNFTSWTDELRVIMLKALTFGSFEIRLLTNQNSNFSMSETLNAVGKRIVFQSNRWITSPTDRFSL